MNDDVDEARQFRRMIVTDLVHRFAQPANEMNNRWKVVEITERDHYTYVVFAVDYVRVVPGPSPFRTSRVQFRVGDSGAIEATP